VVNVHFRSNVGVDDDTGAGFLWSNALLFVNQDKISWHVAAPNGLAQGIVTPMVFSVTIAQNRTQVAQILSLTS